MKKMLISIVLLVSMLITSSVFAFQSKGVVVYYDGNNIVIQDLNYLGYTVGDSLSFVKEGDIVVGDLDTVGTEDFYNITQDESFSVFIDNSCLSKDEAVDWVEEKVN